MAGKVVFRWLRHLVEDLNQMAWARLAALGMAVVMGAGCAGRSPGFYPLGIYTVQSTAELAEVREAGFNLVTGPADRAFLDAAEKSGLRVLAAPGTVAGAKFNAARARATVRELDSHRALWAWYLVDEPDLNRVPPDEVRQVNRFLKNAGATKPTALTIHQGYSALHYGTIPDVLMVDRYPIPWLPLANFPQHVRMAKLGAGAGRPLIAVIQAFDWSCYPEQLPGEKDLRAPSHAELRCMAYAALVQGARGIFFYPYNDKRWKAREHPEVWSAVRMVAAEVNQRKELFQAEALWWAPGQQFGDPSTRFNEALEGSIQPALLRVRRGNEKIPAGDYILAVNTTGRSHSYRVLTPGEKANEVEVVGEDRRIGLEDGWLEDEFGPYAVHVYGPLQQKSRR